MQEIKIYKCEKCGKIVIELQTSSASVVCCGEKMKKFCVNTNNGSTEKHVPCIVSEKQNAITMQVGEIKHDMSEAHFINWIGAFNENEWIIKWLKPNNQPEATFLNLNKETEIYEMCNIHGLWKVKIN